MITFNDLIEPSSTVDELRAYLKDHDVKVCVTVRTYPIRVGNTPTGYSGPFYPDSREVSWNELETDPEYTTNTKRQRRIATFSHQQYQKMLEKLRPDYVFLNFVNYASEEDYHRVFKNLPKVTHYGLGPSITEIFER